MRRRNRFDFIIGFSCRSIVWIKRSVLGVWILHSTANFRVRDIVDTLSLGDVVELTELSDAVCDEG